jgi:heme oxygenase
MTTTSIGSFPIYILPAKLPEESETSKEDHTAAAVRDQGYGINLPELVQANENRKQIEEGRTRGLWSALHHGTYETHKRARENEFLNSLIKGNLAFCSKAYVLYLCNLYTLHVGIEKAQAKIVDKYGKDFFVFPILFRSEKLRHDIKIWSIFNTLSPKFADLPTDCEEFIKNIHEMTEEITRIYVRRIETIVAQESELFRVIGILYALYGTILSGGQFVKAGRDGESGVKSGFLFRIDDNDAEVPSHYFEEIQKKIKENPACKNELAEQSVSFFSFPTDFSIPAFKILWHKNLDGIREKLSQDENTRETYEKMIIEEANTAIDTVLGFISSLLTSLKSGKYNTL